MFLTSAAMETGPRGKTFRSPAWFRPGVHFLFAVVCFLALAVTSGRAQVHETFDDDPLSAGRFTAQLTGTESSFSYDSIQRNLRAVLDVDFDAATLLSRPLPEMTDRQDLSFSVRFKVTGADESGGFSPSAVIGLVTTRHVDNFGDGLSLTLTVRRGKLFAGANIDSAGLPKSSSTNIVLEIGKEYLAYARYSAETRALSLTVFGGTNFIDQLGATVTDSFPSDRPFTVDRLGLQNAGAKQIDSAVGSLTVLIDDLFTPGVAPVNLSIDDVRVLEASRVAIFPIRLPLPAANDVLVDYETQSGTAIAGADFEATSGTLTIPAGSTLSQISVPIKADGLAETNETFSVRLSNARGGTIAAGLAVGTIIDTDRTIITAPSASVLEGNSSENVAHLFLGLSNPSVLPVSVQYRTVDGTASAGTDYLSTNGTIVFPPGTREAGLTVIIKGDNVSEGNEQFFIELLSPVNAELSTNRLSIEIRDDDPLPLLSVGNSTFTEGDFGVQSRAFVATLSSPSSTPISFRYSTRDGTAVAGQDYTAITQVVTIPPGQIAVPLPVTLLGDQIPEDDETFQIVLSTAVNAVLANTTALGIILDDDRIPEINIDAAQVREGNNGETNLNFRVWLSKISRNVIELDYLTVSRAASASSATAGVDYLSANGHLIFPPGVTNLLVSIPVIGDLITEETESFDVQLSSPLNGVLGIGKAQGSILDDDGLTLQVTAPPPTLESDGFDVQSVFIISLTGTPTRPVTVSYSTRDGSAFATLDYVPTSGTLTFEPGENTKTVSVAIKGDLEDEPDETFELGLSNASGATITVPRAIAVIRDNDPPQLRIDDLANIPEGGTNATIARFWARLSSPSEQEIQVDFATEDGTATAGADYAPRNGRLVFAPGVSELPIDITILPDSVDELDETFYVNLLNPLHVRLSKGQAAGTIRDDDPAPIITIDDLSVGECADGSSTATAIVRLSAPAEHPVSVQFATRDGSALAGSDYVQTNGIVVFPPGSTEQTIAVQLICDGNDEPSEGFGIGLSGPDGGSLGGGGGASGEVTIIDNDPPEIQVFDTAVREGNVGLTNATFRLQLSSALEQEIAVSYFTASGTATAGADYADVGATLVFPPGVTSTNITVPVINDIIPEGHEFFRLILTNALNAKIVRGEAIGTILDDDLPDLQVSDPSVVEGDQGLTTLLVPLVLSRPLLQNVSVAFSTRGGTATAGVDYQETNGFVLFAPGETNHLLSLQVIGDTLTESPETFILAFFNPTNVFLPRQEVTITIADDDGTPVLSAADVAINEGDAGQKQLLSFVLKLSRASQQTVSVQVETSDGTATNPADYVRLFPKTIQFAPNVLTQRVSVTINGDAISEGDEDFYLSLSNPAGLTLARTQVRAVIRDDDAPPKLSVNDPAVLEGSSGATNAIFIVSLNSAANQSVSFSYRTVNDTARAGTDFIATSGTITLPPGTLRTNLAVSVLGDREVELDETFLLEISDASGAEIDRPIGTATIINDDGIAILVDDASATEPDQGEVPIRFTFRLAKPVLDTVSVQYETAPGTASANIDYRSAAGTITFPRGITNQTVDIFIKGDLEDEPDETFRLLLRSPVNASLVRAEAIGTIIDNDPPRVSIDDVVVNGSLSSTEANFTVSLSTPSRENVSVHFVTANGTATAGTDFIQATNVLGFRPGETTRRLTIPVLVNTRDEGNEVFFVRLFAPTNATPGKMQGFAEILNEEKPNLPPQVEVVAPANNSIFPADVPIAVAVTASDADGEVAEVRLSENSTLLARFTERPYVITLSNATPGLHVLQAIARDDKGSTATSAPVAITIESLPILTGANTAVEEGDSGTRLAGIPLHLSRPALQAVTVEYDLLGETATAGIDFIAAPGLLVFAPGETNKSVPVPIIGDEVYEGDEVFHLLLKHVAGASTPDSDLLVTILDDDQLPVLSVDNPSVVEGDSGSVDMVFTLTLSGETSLAASVQFRTENGTALAGLDYTPKAGTLFFGGGTSASGAVHALSAPSLEISRDQAALRVAWDASAGAFHLEESDALSSISWRRASLQAISSASRWSIRLQPSERQRFYRLAPDPSNRQEIRVPVLGDTLVEAAENLFLILENPVHLTIATPRGEGVIVDNDQPSLTIEDVRLTEGNNGTAPANFLVKLSAAATRPVSVGYSTIDGTAIAAADYIAQSATITFSPGETEKTITVSVLGDTVNELNETFSVKLSAPVNAIIARGSATCLIEDDDAEPDLLVQGASVVEGNSGITEAQATLALSRASSLPIVAAYRTEDNTAHAPEDYESASGNVTFAPGEVTKPVPLRIRGDLLNEGNESFFLRAAKGTIIPAESPLAEVLIVDDDLLPQLRIDDLEVPEGDSGTTAARFTVHLLGATSRSVTVNAASVDGTALAGLDYLETVTSLTFAPGETAKTFDVPILGDLLDEPDEFFSIVLSSPLNATLARAAARGTIRDDDAPAPRITVADTSIAEGDSGFAEVQLGVSLSAPSKQAVRVNYRTAEGTARTFSDFQPAEGSLSFAPGETAKTIKLLIVGDLLPEPDEFFTVEFLSPFNAVLEQSQVRITIHNDDVPSLKSADVDVIEGTGGTTEVPVTLSLSIASFQPVTATYTTVPGSATAGADYQSVSDSITFSPGETNQVIILKVIADSVPEPGEEFYVDLSAPTGATLATSRITIRVRDDDGQRQPPSVSVTFPLEGDVFPVGTDLSINTSVQQGSASIEQVQVFVDNALLGSSNYGPALSFPWSNAPEGQHVLKAVVTEAGGVKTESALVHVKMQAGALPQRVAIVQNYPDAEIVKLQSWLAEMDLTSRVFNQEGLTFEALAGYDLIIWDDLGTTVNGLTANDVAIFKQLHDADKALYLVGTKLLSSGNNLSSGALRELWTDLTGLKPGTGSLATRFTVRDDRHPVISGGFGLVGEFAIGAVENVSATLLANESVAGVNQSDLLVVSDDRARIAAQNLLPTGGGVNSATQREKLFKNSVSWLLRLAFPPFLNLSLDSTLNPLQPTAGSTFQATFKIQHSGELAANGIILTVSLPSGITYVSSDLPADKCIFDDGALLCFLGNLARAENVSTTLTLRVNTIGESPISANVSSETAEAVVDDNTIDLFLPR